MCPGTEERKLFRMKNFLFTNVEIIVSLGELFIIYVHGQQLILVIKAIIK
jgi:hypothetical protein